MTFNRILLPIGVCLILVGCSTYSEIKNQEVDRNYEVSGVHSEEMSACMQEVLREQLYGLEIHRNFDPRYDKWIIAVEHEALLIGGGVGNYPFSLSFLDTSQGATIELRSLKTIWGGLQAPEDDIDEYIRECAEVSLRR